MTTLNQGQIYEKNIQGILARRNLLPIDLNHNDAGFIHQKKTYYVEVKNRTAPDFGQKKLNWNKSSGWQWSEKDIITDLYDKLGVINLIDKNFVPRRYTIEPNKLTPTDRSYDQQQFEKRSIPLNNTSYLYEFYARKQCFYIQVEDKGFYYLKQDEANLGVPKFTPLLMLRLRAKAHSTLPSSNYSFFAVLQANQSGILPSAFDIEEKAGRKFPPIIK